MPNRGSQRPVSPRKQDAATFSDKQPSTKQHFACHASACPSFRIYYYNEAAGSIPFEWESHPGTPKHPSSDLPPPPPLTPPPSHFSFSTSDQIRRRGTKKPMKKILTLIQTMRFWLTTVGRNGQKVKKLSDSSPSGSERVLICENDYHLFKLQRKRKVMCRSRVTSCFGTRRCFIW